MTSAMEKSQPSSGREVAGSGQSPPAFEVPALPEGIGLQPQLDSIFADVQASLPSIDFEVSDVSSDEEIAIVNRSLKMPTTFLDDHPHHEQTMSPESWRLALEPGSNTGHVGLETLRRYTARSGGHQSLAGQAPDVNMNGGHQPVTRKASDSCVTDVMSRDTAILQVGTTEPWTLAGAPLSNQNGNHEEDTVSLNVQTWADLVNTLGVGENSPQGHSLEDQMLMPHLPSPRNNRDAAFQDMDSDDNRASSRRHPTANAKPRRPSTDSEKIGQTRGSSKTSPNSVDVKRVKPGRPSTDFEKTQQALPETTSLTMHPAQSAALRRPSTDLEKISALLPTQIPTLAMQEVEDIDLDLLLNSFPAAGSPISFLENRQRPSGAEMGGGDGGQKDQASLKMMEKLAQLCVKQSDGALSESQLLGPSQKQQQQQVLGQRKPAAVSKETGSIRKDPSTPSSLSSTSSGRRVAWADQTATGMSRPGLKTQKDMSTNTGMDELHKPPKLTASIGVSTQGGPPLDYSTRSVGVAGAGLGQAKKGRTETVFMDLRSTTKTEDEKEKEAVPEAVKRILKLNASISGPDSVRESDNDEDEDLEAWRENRKRGLAGPSLSKNKTKKGSANKAPPPPRVIIPPPAKDQTEAKRATEGKTTSPTLATAKGKAPATVATRALSNATPSTPPPSPTSIPVVKDDGDDAVAGQVPAAMATATAAAEEMRKKLRQRRQQEQASRLRLQRRLEALRPPTSISGRRPGASATPIVYDLEASYTAAPDCLPPGLGPSQECALLTVRLSTNGEIVLQRCPSSSRSSSESRIGITYPVLLAWLLSLVPPSFEFLAEGAAMKGERAARPEAAPFWVVGLQQVCQGGELVLNAAVTPGGPAPGPAKAGVLKRRTKGLGKEAARDSTPFLAHLATYLTVHTLPAVCPWVAGLFACAVRRDGDLADPPNGSGGGDDDATAPKEDVVTDDGSYVPASPFISNKPLSMLLTVNPDRAAVRRVFGGAQGSSKAGEAAFFWQTVDSDEIVSDQSFDRDATDSTENSQDDDDDDVQTTMSLVYKSIYRHPKHMLGFLYRILQEGLDIAGLRLVYQAPELLGPGTGSAYSPREAGEAGETRPSDSELPDRSAPILAVAVRGAAARSRWLDAVGPSDPRLARRTDPRSLIALFGGRNREEVPIYCPRNPGRVGYELALWFGGRVPESGVVDVGSTAKPDGASPKCTRGQSPNQRSRRGKKGARTDQPSPDIGDLNVVRKPPSMLTATTPSDIFLVVAPIVPPISTGSILCACQIRGFRLRGVRRLRLNNRRVAALGLTGPQIRAFNPLSCTTPTSPSKSYEQSLRERLEAEFSQATPSPMPSLLLLLRKENALHHAPGLMEAMMINLCMNGMLTTIKENSPSGNLTASLCFHMVPYSDSLLAQLGGELAGLPTGLHWPHAGLGPPTAGLYTNPELEQVVVATLSGTAALKTAGSTLSKLLGLYPVTGPNRPPSSPASAGQGLELLGLKWLAGLTAAQARELTPYEVGDRHWLASVQALTASPALVCAVRGLNAPQLVKAILGMPPATGAQPSARGMAAGLERLVSPSAEAAFRQVTLFFRDQELFADPSMRARLPYLPPLRSPSLEQLSTARFAWAESEEAAPVSGPALASPSSKGRRGKGKGGAKSSAKGMLVVEESIYKAMVVGPRLLTTVAVIKPLAVRKHLAKILKRIAQENFTVVALRLTLADDEQLRALIPSEDKEDELLSAMHSEHLQSGPSLLLCLQRENAVWKLLDLLGPANPQEARRASQFLWRGMYGADPINNGIHGSESYMAAVHEQKLLFPDGLCCRETPDLQADQVICLARDGVMGHPQALRRQLVTTPQPVRSESSESLLSPVTSVHSLTSIGSSTSSTNLLGPTYSALCQTNCLLLTPPLLLTKVKGYHRAHIEVVEALSVHGFAVVGMRMVWFREDQAQEYCGIYTKAFPTLPKILCHGPSIVVAVQRDNGVSCFDTLMGSCFDKESVISKHGEHILRPKDPKEATKHLEFFFDRLTPQSQYEIVTSEGPR